MAFQSPLKDFPKPLTENMPHKVQIHLKEAGQPGARIYGDTNGRFPG